MEPSENRHSLNEYGVAGGKKKELYQPSQEDIKPPQLNFKLKKAGDVPKCIETWSDDHLPIDILLLTAESFDFLSCFSLLDKPFKSYKLGIGYVYFGRLGDASDQGKLKIALMNCPKGGASPGGSLTAVLTAVRVLRPKAAFSVGTCISLGLEKVRMGDVVISSKLTAEGFRTPVSPLLGSLIQDAPYGWVAPLENPDELEVKVHYDSDILSQSLREKCRCDDICAQYPEAVAIETEGKGVYAAAYDANIEWVIVKGVASYFHQSQSTSSEWMSFASSMAASVVAKMLNDSAVFREWPHYNQENHGKIPYHPSETTIPDRPRQNTEILGTDFDVSVVVKLLKREYNRRAEFSPLLWSKGMKLQLKEVYTKLRVVSRRKTGSSEIDVDDIFGSSEEDKDPLVLVEGSPGIGKTTFCLKLAHDWANGLVSRNFLTFKLVFLLKCRDMKGDIVEDIFEQLLPDDLKTKEALVQFLEDLHNQKQILIILDGLDELPEKSGDRVNKVLGRKKLSFCYVLATTRQEKGIYTREQFQFDICLVIEGFSEENSFEYIRKHFRNIGTEHSSKGARLIQEVRRNPLLGHLQRNPLNLLLLCVVYEDHEGGLPSSSTDLYQTIVRCLVKRYCSKENLKASEKDEDLDKRFEINIVVLGELAWKCLLNNRLSFYEDELEELERSNENIVARRLGLVYKEESLKRLTPRHAYSFLHKTFQEYLAASYIAHKLRGSKFYVLEQVQFSQVEGEFRQVCLFVCGILREEASILFTEIGDALQKEWDWSKCSREAASFFTDSWKESGNAERMADTLCLFLPFPRVLHVSEYHFKDLINVLEACAGFSRIQTPAEVHVTIPPGLGVHENIQRVLAAVPNVKTLIFPAVRCSVDRAKVGEVLRASKTLEKVTFALSAGRGECWASALDVGLGTDSSLSSVGLRIDGVLNQSALQGVENLLFNKCLSSLSVTIFGDVQESLAKALARGLAGKGAVKFLDLCFNGKLSFDGACSLEEAILRTKSLRNLNLSVNGELPVNWQTVGENLHSKLAEKGVVSAIYPNTFSKVKSSQVVQLYWDLLRTFSVQQNVTLNVWGELSGDGCKAVCEVLRCIQVSKLTLNIHGQLTDEILRCTARCVKEQENLSSLIINAWVQMAEKEKNLIKELGLDKKPLVSLNVCGASASCKESSDSKVISSYEPQHSIASLEKAEKVSYKSLSFTISLMPETKGFWIGTLCESLAKRTSLKSLTLTINDYSNRCNSWGYELGEGLARSTSLNSLTLAINNYSDTSGFCGYELGEGLADFTSLKSLTLAINNYSHTSRFSAYQLGHYLANIVWLNSLTLAINNYSDSNNLWKYEHLEGLGKTESLTECNLIVNICGKG